MGMSKPIQSLGASLLFAIICLVPGSIQNKTPKARMPTKIFSQRLIEMFEVKRVDIVLLFFYPFTIYFDEMTFLGHVHRFFSSNRFYCFYRGTVAFRYFFVLHISSAINIFY